MEMGRGKGCRIWVRDEEHADCVQVNFLRSNILYANPDAGVSPPYRLMLCRQTWSNPKKLYFKYERRSFERRPEESG